MHLKQKGSLSGFHQQKNKSFFLGWLSIINNVHMTTLAWLSIINNVHMTWQSVSRRVHSSHYPFIKKRMVQLFMIYLD